MDYQLSFIEWVGVGYQLSFIEWAMTIRRLAPMVMPSILTKKVETTALISCYRYRAYVDAILVAYYTVHCYITQSYRSSRVPPTPTPNICCRLCIIMYLYLCVCLLLFCLQGTVPCLHVNGSPSCIS